MHLILSLLLAAADAGAAPWALTDVTFYEVRAFDPVLEFTNAPRCTYSFAAPGRVSVMNDGTEEFVLRPAPDAGADALWVQQVGWTSEPVENEDELPERLATWRWLDAGMARTDLDGQLRVISLDDGSAASEAFAASLASALLPEGAYAAADGGEAFSVGADGGVTWASSRHGAFVACYLSCSAKERWNLCVQSATSSSCGEVAQRAGTCTAEWVFVEERGRLVGLPVVDAYVRSDLNCGASAVLPGPPFRAPATARGFKSRPPLVTWPSGWRPNDFVTSAVELRGAKLLRAIDRGQLKARADCGGVLSVVAHDATSVTMVDPLEPRSPIRFVLRGGALISENPGECGELRASSDLRGGRER